jgi:hypothetical protein
LPLSQCAEHVRRFRGRALGVIDNGPMHAAQRTLRGDADVHRDDAFRYRIGFLEIRSADSLRECSRTV